MKRQYAIICIALILFIVKTRIVLNDHKFSPPSRVKDRQLDDDPRKFIKFKEEEYYMRDNRSNELINNSENLLGELTSSVKRFTGEVEAKLNNFDELADRVLLQMNTFKVSSNFLK